MQPVSDYRRSRNRVNKEILRRRIDGEKAIDGIVECIGFLQGLRGIELDVETGQYIAPPPVDSSVIGAVKAEADLHLKLLNKVLPDLKAIEMKDTIAEAQTNGRLMSDTELIHRLRHLGMQTLAAVQCDDDVNPDDDEVELF